MTKLFIYLDFIFGAIPPVHWLLRRLATDYIIWKWKKVKEK